MSKYVSLPRNVKHLDRLIPEMRWRIEKVLAELDRLGYQPVIASSLRTLSEQKRKVAQGYSKTFNSRHLYGRAVDIIDKRWGWNGRCANKDHQFWLDLADEGVTVGLFPGRIWKMKDVAHLELKWKDKAEKRKDMKRIGVI